MFLLCFLGVLGLATCHGNIVNNERPLQYTVCGDPTYHMLEIDSVSISPFPLEMPGEHEINFKGRITRNVTLASLTLSIWKTSGWFNLPVPCISNIGGCHYPDICTLLERMEDENWLGFTADLARQVRGSRPKGSICPILTAELQEQEVLDVPKLPSILALLTNGDYLFHAEMHDEEGRQLVCLESTLSIVPAQTSDSGWLFGK